MESFQKNDMQNDVHQQVKKRRYVDTYIDIYKVPRTCKGPLDAFTLCLHGIERDASWCIQGNSLSLLYWIDDYTKIHIYKQDSLNLKCLYKKLDKIA